MSIDTLLALYREHPEKRVAFYRTLKTLHPNGATMGPIPPGPAVLRLILQTLPEGSVDKASTLFTTITA